MRYQSQKPAKSPLSDDEEKRDSDVSVQTIRKFNYSV